MIGKKKFSDKITKVALKYENYEDTNINQMRVGTYMQIVGQVSQNP